MAGTITHRWDGTTLVVTSDSGTSSCDLKGDTGIRGSQGAPGEPWSADKFDALIEETITKTVEATLAETLEAAYPVGSIYMTCEETNPASLFGGTWTRLEDRFLVGAGNTYTVGATGGEATHTLTTAEMPKHNGHGTHGNSGGNIAGKTLLVEDQNWYEYGSTSRGWYSNSGELHPYVTNAGGDGAHNNLPPYLAVYMWLRTD